MKLPSLDPAAFDAALAQEGPLLVDFSSDWCPPCRVLEPLLEKLADRHGARLRVVQVDASRQRQIAARYGIQGLPTLLLFVGGQVRERQVGLPSQRRLEDMVADHVGLTPAR